MQKMPATASSANMALTSAARCASVPPNLP